MSTERHSGKRKMRKRRAVHGRATRLLPPKDKREIEPQMPTAAAATPANDDASSPLPSSQGAAPPIAPHHLHAEEEQQIAAEFDARPTTKNGVGVLKSNADDWHLAPDIVEHDDISLFARPAPIVTVIVIFALIFICIIAWFIAHEPPK